MMKMSSGRNIAWLLSCFFHRWLVFFTKHLKTALKGIVPSSDTKVPPGCCAYLFLGFLPPVLPVQTLPVVQPFGYAEAVPQPPAKYTAGTGKPKRACMWSFPAPNDGLKPLSKIELSEAMWHPWYMSIASSSVPIASLELWPLMLCHSLL